MSNIKRRDLLKGAAGVAAAATFPMIWVKDAHAQWNNAPEKGAKLRVLRWSRFVQGDIALGAAGSMMVYRESQLKAAGFDSFPKDTDGFLKMMKALHAKGTPGGFALGHATGDANTWCHWVVWAFGGKMVDKSGKVVLD